MQISTSIGVKIFIPKNVSSLADLEEVILKRNYSLGTFKNNERSKENFISAEAIGLDFDGGMTLEEAKLSFADYRHVIATTRNHQKEKNGVTCDRFRVILFLTTPITNAQDFEATWHSLAKLAPACDKACKDASRFFYPSQAVVSFNLSGTRVVPVKYVVKDSSEPIIGQRGELAVNTLRFLAEGAPGGTWNTQLYKAARDMFQQGYTEEETLHKLSTMVNPHFSGKLDTKDVSTIKSAFSKDPLHPPRVAERAFQMQSIGDIYKAKNEKEWVVERLLSVGGLSLMSADPKAGKSTIVRQLANCVLTGQKFLERGCKQGSVFWYGLEEQIEDLSFGFKNLGIAADAQLFVHIGAPMSDKVMEDLKIMLCESKPTLAVIDTLFDMVQVESEKNYNEVKAQMAKLSHIARISGTHIVCLHHNNKAAKDDTRRGTRAILGSTAIFGKVDCAMVIEQDETRRYMTTKGRGIRGWFHREIIFDEKKLTYTLGPDTEEF